MNGKKLVGYGESVVDFIPVGQEDGCTLYKACPGGSVANLCVVAASLGISSAFVGGVGQDRFGAFLQERIAAYGVDTQNMVFTKACGTNLTFVHIDGEERSYSSVNWPGADKMVGQEDIDLDRILDGRILHVSSNAMALGTNRITQPVVMAAAKTKGMLISYDVNYRSGFYQTVQEALSVLRTPLQWADIVKVTEEELDLLTGGRGKEHVHQLLDGAASLVLITRGSEGCDYYTRDFCGHVDAMRVNVVDTVGAGDCFLGGFLSWMLQNTNLDGWRQEEVRAACLYGNRAAGLSVQKTGAMSSVPTCQDMQKLYKELEDGLK